MCRVVIIVVLIAICAPDVFSFPLNWCSDVLACFSPLLNFQIISKNLGTLIDSRQKYQHKYGADFKKYANELYTENNKLLTKISSKFRSASSMDKLPNYLRNNHEVKSHIDTVERNLKLAEENLIAPTDSSKLKQYEQAILYATSAQTSIKWMCIILD